MLIVLLWFSYQPVPPELPWGPEVSVRCGLHEHACEELPGGPMLWCPDMRPGVP
jgi:hypothetical protein